MMAVTIRPYEEKDRPQLRRICLETAPPSAIQTEQARRKTLLLYNDYYTEFEGAHCFVADENGRAVGYILCAPDYTAYAGRFRRHILKRLWQISPRSFLNGCGELAGQRFNAKTYPAHLHIDLLPSHQRMGLGSRLVEALTSHLKAQGIPGVKLTVAASNPGAIAFYQACGFRRLSTIGGGVVMGLNLKRRF